MKQTLFSLILASALLLAACGPSEQEIATMTASAWTATPPPTSTPTPAPTATPIPYDLTISVVDEGGQPITGATVQLADEEQPQTVDDTGKATWNNLPNETANLSADAQGYGASEETLTLERGPNEFTVTLASDPSELRPDQACLPSESLLAIEDFEDERGQEWGQIAELSKPAGWSVVPNPEDSEDLVLQITGDAEFADVSHPTPRNFVYRWWGRIDGSGRWGVSLFERRTADVPKTQYNVFLGSDDSVVHKFDADAGLDNPLVDGPMVSSNTWHQFEISFYEGTIQIWADGQPLMSYTDPEPFPGDGRGSNLVVFPEDASTIFYADDFSLCELSAPFAHLSTNPSSSQPADLNAAFRDDFEVSLAPGAGWRWENENPDRWSVSEEGWLVIQADNPPLTEGIVNLLWRPLPAEGDVIATTLVSANPAENFQQAGIFLFNEELSYVSIVTGFCQPCLPDAGGRGVFLEAFHQGENLLPEPVWFPRQESDSDIYLRLEYSPDNAVVAALYAFEPGEWQQAFVLRNVPSLTRTGIGAANLPGPDGSSGDLIAQFDFFELELP